LTVCAQPACLYSISFHLESSCGNTDMNEKTKGNQSIRSIWKSVNVIHL
jgi:hypothetical protein